MSIESRRFRYRRLMKINLGFKTPYFEIAAMLCVAMSDNHAFNVCVFKVFKL